MADMARRELLTDDERGRLFGIPEEEAELIRHYTLSPAEFDLAADRRGSRNRLGFAVQLCLLRYPGFKVTLHFGEGPISGTDRKTLAASLHEAVKGPFVPFEGGTRRSPQNLQ